MKDIDKYIELAEKLTEAGEKHLEALREFDKYQGNMDIKKINRMIGNDKDKDKYIKLLALEERYSIVEDGI